MSKSQDRQDELECLFPGDSEMAKRMRAMDWSTTELCSPSEWPEELRYSIRFCLSSGFPMAILWGPNYILLYNDAYISCLGAIKHPQFLAKPTHLCWQEVWDEYESILKSVITEKKIIWMNDKQHFFARNLPQEEVFIRLSLGPILDKNGQSITGILCTPVETTEVILSGRRLELLRKLSMRTIEARTVKIACEQTTTLMNQSLDDLSFAAIYLLNDLDTLQLTATAGLADTSLFPEFVVISPNADEQHQSPWPIASVFHNQCSQTLTDLSSIGLQLPGGKWPEASNKATILPILSTQEDSPAGILVLGVSPRLVFNDAYRSFFDLVAGHISAAITNAKLIESGQWIRERTQGLEILRETDRRKDNFLAMLSHELRNPLAAISNCSYILSHTPEGSRSSIQAQATIERQLQQITQLVDDLLDITRITQNKIQLRLQRLDINQIVARTIEDHRPIFDKLNIELKVAFSAMPIMVHADPIRLTQVIFNLLHNASKFSLHRGLTQVWITLEDPYAVVRVVDNGIGIEPALIETLFEPFMQADRSLDRSQGGLGLGLALVKGIVELHGGKVKAHSEGEGKGAEFTIKLPLVKRNNELNEALETKEKKARVSRNVLIIDDNFHIADSLGMVIELFGHTIHIAYNGPDGIQKAREIKPDFILCDIGLPDMSGYQVAEILKADESLSQTYLIALSGYAQPNDIEKSRLAGFDLHLAKPPNLSKLEDILLGNIKS